METIISDQFKKTILHEALKIFKAEGVRKLEEGQLIKKLGISNLTFHELAMNKDDMFKQAVINDMTEQRAKHEEIIAGSSNAIEQLMNLLRSSLDNAKDINPAYLEDFISFPELWELIDREINEYSIPMYQRLLNNGIREGVFRKDINIDIVTKVIMQNIYIMLNFKVFPPERYNTGEVLRSIYLYYFRGLCENDSARMVDNYFA
jgi:AcrR family transcriptional regulator